MNLQQIASSSVLSPLSQVVHSRSAATVADNKKFRHYGANLVARSQVKGVNQSNTVNIQYRVGLGATDRAGALRVPPAEKAVSQQFRPNEVTASSVTALARKYSNFTGQFERADLSGIIARLAQCVGVYALTKKLSFSELKGSAPTVLRTLAVMDDPVAATPRTVFIPRVTSDSLGPDVFSALVGAANACGASVVTDVCSVDANNNAPLLRAPADGMLAAACWQGIRLLLAMYDESDAGAIASYAFYAGVHRAMTVVGHSDEGAYVRDVWRAKSFAVPYGGIYCANVATFVGMPMPDVTDFNTFASLMDGAALLSAGLVAMSDPLIQYRGQVYPTIVAARNIQPTGGRGAPSESSYSPDLTTQVAAGCSVFCGAYIANLARSLMVGEGGADMACAHMEACFSDLAGSKNRHLEVAVAAPFYWVEPTSLIHDASVYRSKAQDCGYGVYAGTERPGAVPYFEKLLVKREHSCVEHWFTTWRTARTCGAVLLHRYNALDGLGALIPRQAAYDGFALRGGPSEDIRDSFRRSAPLSDYLWERGDAGVPAPAELVYTGEAIAFSAVKQVMDPDTYNVVEANLKGGNDHGDMVHVMVGTPQYMRLSDVGTRTPKVIRGRTLAAASLAATKIGALRQVDLATGGEDLAIIGESPVAWLVATDAPVVSGVEVGSVEVAPPRATSRGQPAARVTQMAADHYRQTRPPARQEVRLTVAPQTASEESAAVVSEEALAAADIAAPTLQAGGPSSAPPAQQ